MPDDGTSVQVTVLDLAGRRVRRLVEDHRPAGVHRVTWDGRDDGGRNVGSGVYFVRLTADAFQSTRRLVLTR